MGAQTTRTPLDSVSRRARSRWARLPLLAALLEVLEEAQALECLEDQDQGCQEVQECQEADTATLDVSASTCPATWGPEEAPECPRCHQQDLDLASLDLELVHLDQDRACLPLVATEQALLMTASVDLPRGRQGSLVVRRSRSTNGPGRPAWSGAAARPCSAEPLLSATSGF